MKLEKIIESIQSRIIKNSKPNLVEYAQKIWPKYLGNTGDTAIVSLFTNTINSYLDEFFISKNEALFWMKSINEELKQMRKFMEEKRDKQDIEDSNI